MYPGIRDLKKIQRPTDFVKTVSAKIQSKWGYTVYVGVLSRYTEKNMNVW